ncbi:MAG: hypothetical protein LQ340_002925 [Diploschistes diacapsis]|nr:MAG: hypothetical protein LQ340_002925 [Diploschistes diacapsis]
MGVRSIVVALGLAGLAAGATDVSSCSCGFYDAEQDNLWTDSIVVYFNESNNIPEDIFWRENWRNTYEQGWNAQFVTGSATNNSWIGNSTSQSTSAQKSLQLFVEPSTAQHLVVGGGVRTQRQDIQYGSFRAMMKGPARYAGGTSLTMELAYNLTQQVSLNIMNTAEPDTAWISTLINHEFPNRYLGVNLTNITNQAFGANPITDPWGYNIMRLDWTPTVMNYWLGNNLSRSVTGACDDGSARPTTPSPLTLKHWSDGNEYAMEGPPWHNESEANILYVRAFFNTSSLTSDEEQAFNSRCNIKSACSTDDLELRGSTPYPESATQYWQQQSGQYTMRWPAVGIGSFGLLISLLTIINVTIRRFVLPDAPKKHEPEPSSTESEDSNSTRGEGSFISGGTTPLAAHRSPYASGFVTPATSGARTLVPGTPNNLTRPSSIRDIPPIPEQFRESSMAGSSGAATPRNITRPSSARGDGEFPPIQHGSHDNLDRARFAEMTMGEGPTSPGLMSGPETPFFGTSVPTTPFSPSFGAGARNLSFLGRPAEQITYGPAVPVGDTGDEEIVRGGVVVEPNGKGKNVAISTSAAPKDATVGRGKPAGQRVDYLAGLLAICSTFVSLTHYMLTFVPAVIEPGAFTHYPSENLARKTVGWFFFNEAWVVLFFTTSSRFLTTKYLRTGDLGVIAEKATGRTFRLMIPIIGVIVLEYFLMDVGAVDWLQYLSSVTWSTWPYTVVYDNFGDFVSETLELIYLIPNGRPQITSNYCTGVLWTIPVQLDGSWQAMLAVIVFREIKAPWKRITYYLTVIALHWYGRSWGAFFVAGLCMADMDVTYKYRKWLLARPWIYYPALNLVILLALAGLGNDLVSNWIGIDFQIIEDGWHIDKRTGLARIQAGNSGFPAYYVPKLNGLVFAICAQLLVEWSAWFQKVISVKIVLWLFPHIFTIYLFHGFIFWSVGSALCISLSSAGVPYWANLLLVAIVCYTVLYLSLPIITPVVEALGKTVTNSIWASASEQPAPKRRTLYPFPDDLFVSRNLDNPFENASVIDSSASSINYKPGKGGKGSMTTATGSSASSFAEKPTTADGKAPNTTVSDMGIAF